MRIGIVADGLRYAATGEVAHGGVGVYVTHLIEQLRKIDAGNEYVIYHYGAAVFPEIDARVRSIRLPDSTFHRYARWLDFPYRSLARLHRLDLLHYPNQFGGALLPKPLRRVVTLHDITPLLYPRHHPARSVIGYLLLLRRSLRDADHVIVDSEAIRSDVLARRLADERRVSVIPLGCSSRFHPAARVKGFSRRYDLPQRFVLNVGVLEPRKNHRLLVEALRILHREGERVGLVIAGRKGWRWRNPLADPSLADLRGWVRVLPDVSDDELPTLYGSAEVFAYPSLYEGFGLPILEAMACGVPVVTSDRSAMPEVGGDAALYADPTDASSFAAQILRLLRDHPLRERLVRAGIRRGAELTWERTAEQTLEVYEQVCNGP